MLEVTYCASSIDVANFQFPSAIKCKLLTAVHLRDMLCMLLPNFMEIGLIVAEIS